MRKLITGALLLGAIATLTILAAAENPPAVAKENPATQDSVAATPASGPKIIATYFHGNRRCATCQRLEAYSQEAITTGFATEIENGLIEWRVVNFDEKENEHFATDYELFSQSVILSRVDNGTQIEWKNLDKIWTLVGDKDKFLAYVRDETKAFMTPEPKK